MARFSNSVCESVTGLNLLTIGLNSPMVRCLEVVCLAGPWVHEDYSDRYMALTER